MDFLLDNDVDAEVGRMLRRHGHTCATARDVGLIFAADDEYTVFSSHRGWALISHDNAFSARRRRQSIGQHVHLRCEQPDGPETLEHALVEVCAILGRIPNVWIEVSRRGLQMSTTWA